MRRAIVLAESIWKHIHTEHRREKKNLVVFVIFLVSHFCLVTIFSQRQCVRRTLAWIQERMEACLRNINISLIEKAVYNLAHVINLLINHFIIRILLNNIFMILS